MIKKRGFSALCLGIGALLVLADQWIKAWAFNELRTIEDIRLIPNVLHLMYRENYGAAFSILQNKTFFLIGVTSVVLVLILVYLVFGRMHHPLMPLSLSLVLAGGTGNLIDRVMRGFVVDYIYFVPIDFPVFNLADCCVVSGTVLLAIYLLWIEPRQKPERRRSR